MGNITENVHEVRRKIEAAAAESGRKGSDIILIGATKMNSAERVREAVEAGLDVCGENRVQEMLEKNEQHAYDGVPLHFIGHLQKNKVKNVVGLAELIHSVDSLELLDVINKTAASKGIIQDVLLEVNVGHEESKSGFTPDDIPGVLDAVGRYSSVKIRGLMAIPPKCNFPEENLTYFCTMYNLFVDNGKKKYDNVCMDFLSMGMSSDYTAAISCGANMVRVGSAIFGERIYPDKKSL